MNAINRNANCLATSPSFKRAKRILFVGESICLAHVGRPAMLARWAKHEGYEVTFACGPTYAQAAESEGISTVPLFTVDPQDLFNRLKNAEFFYTPQELDSYVQAERAIIRDVRPDLIVGDFRLTLSISAKLENVPMLSLINSHWSPGHPCPLPAPYNGVFKLLSPRVRDTLFRSLRPLLIRLFAKPIDDVRERNGLARLNDVRKIYAAGDMCAYLDAPEFMPVPNIPHGHFFLGPLLWKPRISVEQETLNLPGQTPLVYVSMGSSGDKTLLPNILKALEMTSYHVFLSGVDSQQANQFHDAYPNLRGRLHSRALVDPDAILKRAQLTICHGGSGTVYQSLTNGVPLLCIPTNLDQGLIAQTVQASGFGLNVVPEQTSVSHLSAFLKRFPGPFAKATKQLSLALQSDSSEDRWVRWLRVFFDESKMVAKKSDALQPQAPRVPLEVGAS